MCGGATAVDLGLPSIERGRHRKRPLHRRRLGSLFLCDGRSWRRRRRRSTGWCASSSTRPRWAATSSTWRWPERSSAAVRSWPRPTTPRSSASPTSPTAPSASPASSEVGAPPPHPRVLLSFIGLLLDLRGFLSVKSGFGRFFFLV